MPLSSLTKNAASDAAFVSKRESGIRCQFRFKHRRRHQMPLSFLTKTAASDAAFHSNKKGGNRFRFRL